MAGGVATNMAQAHAAVAAAVEAARADRITSDDGTRTPHAAATAITGIAATAPAAAADNTTASAVMCLAQTVGSTPLPSSDEVYYPRPDARSVASLDVEVRRDGASSGGRSGSGEDDDREGDVDADSRTMPAGATTLMASISRASSGRRSAASLVVAPHALCDLGSGGSGGGVDSDDFSPQSSRSEGAGAMLVAAEAGAMPAFTAVTGRVHCPSVVSAHTTDKQSDAVMHTAAATAAEAAKAGCCRRGDIGGEDGEFQVGGDALSEEDHRNLSTMSIRLAAATPGVGAAGNTTVAPEAGARAAGAGRGEVAGGACAPASAFELGGGGQSNCELIQRSTTGASAGSTAAAVTMATVDSGGFTARFGASADVDDVGLIAVGTRDFDLEEVDSPTSTSAPAAAAAAATVASSRAAATPCDAATDDASTAASLSHFPPLWVTRCVHYTSHTPHHTGLVILTPRPQTLNPKP